MWTSNIAIRDYADNPQNFTVLGALLNAVRSVLIDVDLSG